MKTLQCMLVAVICLLLSTACSSQGNYASFFGGETIKASKNYVTKEIFVEDFTGLNLKGSPNVIFTQRSGKPKVSIHTSDNIIDLLDVHVDGNTLHIGFRKNISVNYHKLTIQVSSPALNRISVAGSGTVKVAGQLTTKQLALSVSGSGDILGTDITCTQCKATVTGSGDIHLENLTATTTQAEVTGSGDISLKGKTTEATYKITGSGDLAASGLKAETVSASVTGSGDIECHASAYLKTRITGSGDIGYKGNPQIDNGKKGLHRL